MKQSTFTIITCLGTIILAFIVFSFVLVLEQPPATYLDEVSQGSIEGTSSILKFGHNGDVGASLETIWSGSTLYSYLDSADQLEIFSSNDEDGGAGGDTGALTLELFCLDSSYNPIEEIITLNGTTVVTSTISCLRNYRNIVRSAGSAGWNIGTITIRDQDTDTTRALIDPFLNQTLMALFTIPANTTGFITSMYASTSSSKSTEIYLFIRPFGEVFQVKNDVDLMASVGNIRFDIPLRVEARSDIEMRTQVPPAAGDVDGGFDLLLVEN